MRKQIEEEKARLLEAVSQQREELRALAIRLAEVQEAERQQLARELHDQVGQNLSALGFNLNFVRTQIPPAVPSIDLIRSRLDDSLALVEQTGERVRDVLAELRPPVLDDYGLVDTLDWYAERFSARVGLAIKVSGKTLNPRLAPPIENALFRIAQEALTNVAKHAEASQVNIFVEADLSNVCLVISDNGIGFESNLVAGPAAERQGWGLLTMTERAVAVDGCCLIESRLGQGTRVTVKVKR
jgi:two-component system sensor histidine kinase UhpB